MSLFVLFLDRLSKNWNLNCVCFFVCVPVCLCMLVYLSIYFLLYQQALDTFTACRSPTIDRALVSACAENPQLLFDLCHQSAHVLATLRAVSVPIVARSSVKAISLPSTATAMIVTVAPCTALPVKGAVVSFWGNAAGTQLLRRTLLTQIPGERGTLVALQPAALWRPFLVPSRHVYVSVEASAESVSGASASELYLNLVVCPVPVALMSAVSVMEYALLHVQTTADASGADASGMWWQVLRGAASAARCVLTVPALPVAVRLTILRLVRRVHVQLLLEW